MLDGIRHMSGLQENVNTICVFYENIACRELSSKSLAETPDPKSHANHWTASKQPPNLYIEPFVVMKSRE